MIKHAAIQGSLDQEITVLKAKLAEAERKLAEVRKWAEEKVTMPQSVKLCKRARAGAYQKAKDELKKLL